MVAFAQGDIVEFSLPDGRIVLAWILHISNSDRFSDAFGFIVLALKSSLHVDLSSTDLLSIPFLGPFYSDIVDAVEHYHWKAVAHQVVSPAAWQLTRRSCGGNEYLGDECLGPEPRDGSLKDNEPAGMLYVYNVLEDAFGVLPKESDHPVSPVPELAEKNLSKAQRLERVSFQQVVKWCDKKIQRSVLHYLNYLRVELIAGAGSRKKKETRALFKGVVLGLNEIQEETQLILTEERDAICDALELMGNIVELDSISEDLDRWRKW